MREYEVRFPDSFPREFDFINLFQVIQRFVIESKIFLTVDFWNKEIWELSRWTPMGLWRIRVALEPWDTMWHQFQQRQNHEQHLKSILKRRGENWILRKSLKFWQSEPSFPLLMDESWIFWEHPTPESSFPLLYGAWLAVLLGAFWERKIGTNRTVVLASRTSSCYFKGLKDAVWLAEHCFLVSATMWTRLFSFNGYCWGDEK